MSSHGNALHQGVGILSKELASTIGRACRARHHLG
jgi:hypothetical protein